MLSTLVDIAQDVINEETRTDIPVFLNASISFFTLFSNHFLEKIKEK